MINFLKDNLAAILVGVGGVLAAGGSCWSEFRADKPGHSSSIRPALIILLGAVVGIVGTYWSSVEQGEFEHQLRTRSDDIARLSTESLKKSDKIAELNRELAQKSDQIAILNKETADAVTGGSEFCLLEAHPVEEQHRIFVLVSHSGKYPMYDVAFRVLDFRKSGDKPMMEEMLSTPYQVGNLAAHHLRFFAYWPLPIGKDHHAINIFFTARNAAGFVTQELRFAKVKGVWKTATRVTPMSGTRVLYQSADKDFPRGARGKIDWNDKKYSE